MILSAHCSADKEGFISVKYKYYIVKHIPTGTAPAYFKVRAFLDKKSRKTRLYQKFKTVLPLMSPKDTSDESFSKIFAR